MREMDRDRGEATAMFTMRQLDERDLDQFNALLRYAFQVTSDDLVKSGWAEDEIKVSKAPILKGSFVLGWFHKERLASQVVVYPMQVNIQGELFDMGGVTGVTTYPEYSGRGLIHGLMKECLKHMRQEKQLISYLYPYSIPFYRKMGWEIISDKLSFTIRDTQLPKHRDVPGMVERVRLDHEDFKNVYEYFAMQHHGALIRDELAWEEYWRWEKDDVTAAVYYTKDHRPIGSLVYYLENEVFHIKEMACLNREANHGLWNYIGAHFSMITEVRGDNYSGEPLAFLLEDSEISETIAPYIMARIVDVPQFLERYPFPRRPETLRLHLRVHDALAPWNEGDFLLCWEEDRTRCERVEEGPLQNLIELDIQTLTTLMMGYKRPSYLYNNERLNMEYYLVQVLEQLIPVEKPYFSDYF